MKKLVATTALILSLATSSVVMAGHHEGRYEAYKAKMETALKSLPAEKSALVRNTFEDIRTTRKNNWEAKKANHEALRAMLSAQTFDKQAYLAKANDITRQSSADKLAMHEKIANLAAQLSPSEREVLVDIMPHKSGHKNHHSADQMQSKSE